MKTKPMKHQEEGRNRLLANPECYALGAEQGTGKTWMLLDNAEQQWMGGLITGLLVIAPKGVHTNWVLREVPKHLSIPYVAESWQSGPSQKKKKALGRLLKTDGQSMAIFAINVDGVNTKGGFDYALQFVKTFRCMIAVDESQRIKNPTAKRTKKVMVLRDYAVSRRILSGTLVANSPLDLFSQYQFLGDGLLGTTSYRAFVAEFADLLPTNHPLVQEIAARSRYKTAPQVVRRDKEGIPIYRNIAKLSALMSPYTFRVLKKDCLDLPEKIYQTIDFDLTPAQRKHYNIVKEQQRWEREDGELDIFTALTVINKLQQITSGFILIDGEPTELAECKPRMDALKRIMEDTTGQVIIWARFREEMKQIKAMLEKDYVCVEYHGGTKARDREDAVDKFQSGEAQVFIANPSAAGTGLTLHAAEVAVYYSSDFSLEKRSQSEDRCHRYGLKHPVVYIDLVARDTIDEKIAYCLQNKQLIASEIMDAL